LQAEKSRCPRGEHTRQ